MNKNSTARIGMFCWLAVTAWPVMAQTVVTQVVVLSIQGSTNAWFMRPGWVAEAPLQVSQALEATDIVRTGERTRLLLRLADRTITQVPEMSRFRVEPRVPGNRGTLFTLLRGLAYFFHRDRPDDLLIHSQTASAATRGTDFTVEVDDNDRMVISVLDGEVELRNEQGTVHLVSGQQGLAEPGRTPVKTAVVSGISQIQWCLYYPGVLDPDELRLPGDAQAALQNSLAAYRRGDLLQALALYPVGRQPASPPEAVYLAALLLSVGNVNQSQVILNSIPTTLQPDQSAASIVQLAEAIRLVIATVKQQPRPPTFNLQPSAPLATEWLAESYRQQGTGQLAEALRAARQAVEKSPAFGFAWVRVAELEFSFARTDQALMALEQGLALAPRNAQGLALKGFLLAARNKAGLAHDYFEQAIALDGGLGNAWLGRGLCRIHQGELQAGLTDLEVAAAVEPQRGVLRSYLGKAFDELYDPRRAQQELDLAKELDPRDPTAWLYSALVLQRDNQINPAVHDLEESKELNSNRYLYRSRLLLDQDQAVRGANLAAIYRDAGMTDVSVREAVRAVQADYANFSAHYFLADSYNELRDANQVNLRYETPWFTEYLLATLLAPAGAGMLSPAVSQQEYSRLFDHNRLGLFSRTDYLSSGEWRQSAVQHGRYNNSSYAAEVFYRSRSGERPNNDVEQLALTLRLKHQLTPQDGLFFQASYGESEGGDLNQYYDPSWALPDLRVEEAQAPIILAGYHREWSPGSHTLFLAGYVNDTFQYGTTNQSGLYLDRSVFGPVLSAYRYNATEDYDNELRLFNAELQQIQRIDLQPLGQHTLILGGRYQQGTFQTRSDQTAAYVALDPPFPLKDFDPQEFDLNFERFTAYAYDQWELFPSLSLAGGLSYDWVKLPENFQFPPISRDEESRDQVSPKAGLIWAPPSRTVIRAAYAQSLGGASLDQSVRLEPPQVAGFIQAPRSVIPESAEGAFPVATFETIGVSLEQKLGRGTYLGLAGEWLNSEARRLRGSVEYAPTLGNVGDFFIQGQTPEELDFLERSLTFTANQLIGDEWSLGLRYRLSDAELDKEFSDIPPSTQFYEPLRRQESLESLLHQLLVFALYNHPSGFFARTDALWTAQTNDGYESARPGDNFWQFNIMVGYRFLQRRTEVRVGLLNIADQDYHLNPLNLSAELPHDRTFFTSLILNF